MDISEQTVRQHYGMLLSISQPYEVVRMEVDAAQHRIEAWVRLKKSCVRQELDPMSAGNNVQADVGPSWRV